MRLAVEVKSPVDMVNDPIIYRVLYIPGGCLGFLPSTVLHDTTILETNSEFTPENRPDSQMESSSSNHPFSEAMLVSGSVISDVT